MAKTAADIPASGGNAVNLRQGIAVASVLAAMALVVLDAAMINVALPTIADALRVAPGVSVRVVTVYQAAVVMALLPCAALGESFGNRRLFAAGLALFITASALGASTPSLNWLVAARFVQGIGAAGVMALGVALLRQALPANRIGAAIGWNALTVALCSAAGPTLGAMVISLGSWQWLLVVNLPLGLMALIAALALPAASGTRDRPDPASMALSAGGFAALVFGAEAVAARPMLAGMLLSAASLAFWALFRRELPKRAPLIPIDLLQGRPFRLSVIASICCFAGQTAGMLALPFHLQQGLGLSALMTGLYMTPWPLAVAIAALACARLGERLPSWLMCAAGCGLLATGLTGAAGLPASAGPLQVAALTVLCGLGFGLFQVPNNRTLFLSAPITRSAAAGGMQGTARLTGQAVGAVVMTLLFAWAPAEAAPRLALALGAVFALAAASASFMQLCRGALSVRKRPIKIRLSV